MLNKTVPDFELPATSGHSFKLSDYIGKNLIVYFYPKDSTPGCTTQGMEFRDLYSEFQAANTEIVGVSRDSLKSHENFKVKFSFPFELLSDSEEKACQIFDVIKIKNMYGKQVRGIQRSTFVINKNGVVIQEWRKVKVADHVEEVLAFVKSI
jgi:peroxiredoxin Q/BCP|tara:strand:- start:248 stop:703 length:456 start_codon:yes stop_codon:yes gene_type:complete